MKMVSNKSKISKNEPKVSDKVRKWAVSGENGWRWIKVRAEFEYD
jgi:hypothetical protein